MRMSDLVAKYITEMLDEQNGRTAVRKFSEMNLREILVVCQVK